MHTSIVCTILVAVLAVGCLEVSASENVNNSSQFIATYEWQVVPEGQGIPKGLHVRINLQTGVKEAKLLDTNERDTALQSQTDDNASGSANDLPLSLEHKADIIEESVRKVKEHRSYAELRKAYKDFKKNFRTDGELIVQILEQYRNFSKTSVESELKPKLNSLENLEYLLHQIDNALVFIDKGGLDDVLLPIVVNDTNTDMRASAMRVLGALTGNNPQAQVKVFERNFGSHLAQILMTSTNSAEVSSALHAFGALLRKFPLAQQRILSTSGTQALISVLRSTDIELRNKGKVMTLISDLMLEKRYALEGSRDSSDATSSVAQYGLLELESWLQAHSYCPTLEAVLSKDYVQLLEQPEVVEQFIVGLESTDSLCQPLWAQSGALRHALLTVRNRFSHSQDEYRLEVSQALARLCVRFYDKHSHTEL
ncbi:nucleotide exchange factor Sil1 [Drosophila grimshawi]|uniref:Nucleotide exchange factor SIL1 n=1 Tax=Drosophila grimshawi TaxID=7222 RepID=B4JV10_DROGR|nr:nucleotide exchange factor Sil1 [Drosophila grimshawi]EDV91330.1 GH14615 [Drosophila grimshawi]